MSKKNTLANGIFVDIETKKDMISWIREFLDSVEFGGRCDIFYEILYTNGDFCKIDDTGVVEGKFRARSSDIAAIICDFPDGYSITGHDTVAFESSVTGKKYSLNDVLKMSNDQLYDLILFPCFN